MTEAENFEQGNAVYVDSNVFIYHFEDQSSFSKRVSSQFANIADAGGVLVTSELTIAECCYKPAGDGNTELTAVYEAFFEESGEVRLIALSGSLVKRAALTGARAGLKLLDAIHFVSARDAGCTHFLTADKAFKSSAGLRVVQL
jgi:predicted nucleic acid-binding protein